MLLAGLLPLCLALALIPAGCAGGARAPAGTATSAAASASGAEATAGAAPTADANASAPEAATAAATQASAAAGADRPGQQGGNGGGQVLNVHVDVEISTLDFHNTGEGNALNAMNEMGDGLYRVDADGAPQLAVAESADVSADGLTITYKLRDTAYYDGTPVTARDFVYSWRRLADPALENTYNSLLAVANIVNANEVIAGEQPLDALGVEATDDKTLVVRLSGPLPFIDTLFAFPPFFPLSEDFVTAQGSSFAASPETLLTNGPFYATEYEPNANSVTLARNPLYYRADEISLDGIVYRTVKDPQQAALSYLSGELDTARLSGEQVELYKDDPEYHGFLTSYLWWISPNHQNPDLANLNLRIALAKSFDKDALASNVLKNGAAAAHYYVPPGVATGPDGKDFRDGAPNYFETDKADALARWELAKQELGKDSAEFTLLVEDSDMAISVAQFVQAQIQETLPGVAINVEPLPKKAKADRVSDLDFDFNLHRWGPDYSDPLTFLNLWTSSPKRSWHSDEYDALVADATSGPLTLDAAARWQALHDAEQILGDDAVTFPVFIQGEAMLIKPSVSGAEFHFGTGLHSLRHVKKD
ncbi:MAG: peptide ABC transporter substrate-binding protein [Clostridiales bacterium]|nr:peptide ABC transporter substrate-binding protein [Clostridiales bacterium]